MALRRLVYTARNVVSGYPFLYGPFARRRYPGPGTEFMNDATDLVIDGFPRSANTFAVVAFQLAQTRLVRVAHHVHAAAQVIEAAKRRVPALTLIRRPEDAVTSEVIRRADASLAQCTAAYVRFYRRVLPYVGMVSVATFDEVIGDFGTVTRRLNERFGTSFDEFEHTHDNVEECFRVIELRELQSSPVRPVIARFQSGLASRAELRAAVDSDAGVYRSFRPEVDEAVVPRPSIARLEPREDLVEEFRGPAMARLRRQAIAVFDAVLRSRTDRAT
jgi:hypothetical protein